MRRAALLALLLLGGASGQSAGRYDPGLSPSQRAQIDGLYARLKSPPRVVSTSLADAVRVILAEKTTLTGLVGPLPRELHDALERARPRDGVTLIVGASGSRIPFSARLRVKRTGAAASSSIIATTDRIVFFQGGRVQILDAPLQAQQTRTAALDAYTRLP